MRILKLETWNFAWDLISPIHMLYKKVGLIWEHFKKMVQPSNKFNNCTVQYMQEEVNYDWLYGVQIVSFSIAVDNENNFSRILEGNRRTKRRTRNSWSWTRLKVSQWLKKFSLLTSCDNITSGIMIQLNFYPLNICEVVNYMQKWVINILTMNHVIYLSQPGHVIFFSTSQV